MVMFYAPGKVETKGSARGFVVNGRAVITNDNPRAKAWAKVIAGEARKAMLGRAPIEGASSVRLDFYIDRPTGHYGTGRNAGKVKASAPVWPAVKPDVDKIARCALDALTSVVIADDARVVSLKARKLYADHARPAGVVVQVEALEYAEDSVEGTVY